MDLDDEELKATRKMNGADRRDVNDIKKEEALYKYIMKRLPDELPLEHEIFAIRNHDFHNLDYAIYVDGYISIDAIIKKIKKQEKIENLLKERQSDKERIKELEKERDKIYEDYQDLGKEYYNSIPTSLIKEKIEELKEEDLKIYDTDSEDVRIAKYEQRAVLQVLEELLKGE